MSSYYEKLLATGEVKCIDEEVPFEIPQGWEWTRIGNIFWVTKLAGFEYTKFFTKDAITSTNAVPIVRAQNVRIGKFEENKNEAISITLSNQLERSSLVKRCLLMTFIGAGIGDVCIFPAYRRNHLAPNVAKIEPFNNYCSLEFFLMALMSPLGQLGVNSIKKSTAQPSLSMETIRQILIPIPPLSEQERIVSKIGLVMPIIDKYSKSHELLDKMNVELNECLKKSVLQEAIQGRLVPQIAEEGTAQELLEQIKAEKQKLVKEGKLKKSALNDSVIFRGDDNKYYTSKNKDTICIDDEIPFEIPDSWVWVRFGTIMINRDRERIPLSVAQRQFLSKRYDYYGASGVIDKVDRYLFDKELLLIGEDGANLLNRSTPIAFIAKGKYWVNNHAHVLDVYDGVMLKYIALYINSISLVPYVTGTAQPKMNQEKMNSVLIALPPQKEQQRIVAQIEKLFEQLH